MITIYKYLLYDTSHQEGNRVMVYMPQHSQVLSIQAQNNRVVMWARVDTQEEYESRVFVLVMTGKEMEKDYKKLKYIGTAQLDGDTFVLHIFESPERPTNHIR